MASRRDQLQSYQFLTQRVISAFVLRETDPVQSPIRRGVGAIFASVMIAAIIGAGFGVYGILTKTGAMNWRSDGAVVIEKETGAAYVHLAGRLHPALNYASALLASGQPAPQVFRVSRDALAGAPRGITIGIPGAPKSLPAPDRIVGLPWTLCTSSDPNRKVSRTVTLIVGDAPAAARPLGEDLGLLMTNPGGGLTYLVWHNHRYLLRQPKTVVPALFGAVVSPAVASDAWLNTLPAGMDVGGIAIDAVGSRSPAIPTRNIGDLLVAQTGSGPQHYLVLADGLAPITALQTDILIASSPMQAKPITVADATSAPRSTRLPQANGRISPPLAAPTLFQLGPSDAVCARTDNAASAPTVTVGGLIPQTSSPKPAGPASALSTGLADRVVVPPSRGAIVRSVATTDASVGTYHVITDMGMRYAVPTPEVLPMLGYDPDQAVNVPANLLTRIPSGPALDPTAAIRPAPET